MMINQPSGLWRMPDESELHQRTWMAFGASLDVWGQKLLPEVRRNLALIANTIAQFEPVTMLVRPNELNIARKLLSEKIRLLTIELDDLWIRDTGAVFVVNSQRQKTALDFNFNGWGQKQEFKLDAQVAAFVAQTGGVKRVVSDLTLEGGGIEVDGQGTAIVTESCVLNANRNPNLTKSQAELEFKKLLGVQKVIWLPGIRNMDITDGHTDFYARFASSGVVVAGYDPDPLSFDHEVTKAHLKILRASQDAKGQNLQVVVLQAPSRIRDKYASQDFAAGYINFYVCNGAVIAPEFGDQKADLAAKNTLQSLFPKRKIVQLNIDGIAAGGGGIHCTTQQEPVIHS